MTPSDVKPRGSQSSNNGGSLRGAPLKSLFFFSFGLRYFLFFLSKKKKRKYLNNVIILDPNMMKKSVFQSLTAFELKKGDSYVGKDFKTNR